MNNQTTLELLGINFNKLSYEEILDAIQLSVSTRKQLTICYANVNSINLSISEVKVTQLLSEFNIVHPDGFGVFLGSKILYGKDGLNYRLNGSDLYHRLINDCKNYNYKLFFFGDKNETLNQIKIKHTQLNVVGMQTGFEFDSISTLNKINQSGPDILIVGLGSPKQEEWIIANRDKINTNVIISVGDGIKVFAGTKKRGPKLLQMLGLEWLVRLYFEPKRLWKRYFIGIPLFIFRVIKLKLSINNNDSEA